MARIRTVKPEFWTDERIGQCSMPARLLFIASWNFADDHGGIGRSAKQLKAQAFPYDAIECEPLIQELLEAGLVIEYAVEGKTYLHIKNFQKHQRQDNVAAPRFPVYREESRVLASAREKSREVASNGEDSHGSRGNSALLLEGKGREGNGKEELRPSDVVEQKRSTSLVQEVFEHWKREHGHPKAQLDPKRKRRITEALKHFSVDQLCQAISGYRNSPHHMGTDPRGQGVKYDDIELLLRDSQHIETGLRLLAHPPRPPPQENASERILRKLREPEAIEHEPDEIPSFPRQ